MLKRVLDNRMLTLFVAICLGVYYLAVTRVVHSRFQQDSDGLVLNSMTYASEHGWLSRGPFGLKLPGGLMIAETIQLQEPQEYEPYASQFGLQGHIMSLVAPKDETSRYTVFVAYRFLCATAFALVLLAFVRSVLREFGSLPAWLALIGTSLSPWIAFMAGSVYWLSALLFAPFVFSWCSYDRYRSTGRLPVFMAILFFLFFAKFLCGYEYITVLALLPLVRIVYSSILHAEPWKKAVSVMVVAFSVAIFAFVGAIAVHLIAGRYEFGSFEKAKEVIVSRMKYRVNNVQDLSLLKEGETPPTLAPLNSIGETFTIYATKPTLGPVPNAIELGIVLFMIAANLVTLKKRSFVSAQLRALGWATFAAAAATLSWFLLAYNHTAIHPHINSYLFFLPLYPLLFILLGFSYRQKQESEKAVSST